MKTCNAELDTGAIGKVSGIYRTWRTFCSLPADHKLPHKHGSDIWGDEFTIKRDQ